MRFVKGNLEQNIEKRPASVATHLLAVYNTKEKLDTVTAEIEKKEFTRAALTDFQKVLRSRQLLLTKFDEEACYTLVDYATVYSKDDIRFTFKDGTEIKA